MNRLRVVGLATVMAFVACGESSADDGMVGASSASSGANEAGGEPAAMQERPSGTSQPGAIVQTSAPLPPGTVRMQKVDVMDPTGFAQPVVAGTVLIPAGWRTSGGILWGALGQCGPDVASDWAATSPDGAISIRYQPTLGWNATRASFQMDPPPNDGCERASYTSVREFLEATARRLHPQGRIVDYRPLPEETKPFRELLALVPPTNQPDLQFNFTIEAGEILVAYQENGRDMRAAISAMVGITHWSMNTGGIGMEQISGAPTSVTVVSAPNGMLDFGLRKRVESTVRYTREWSDVVRKHNEEKHRLTMQSLDEAGRARARQHEENMKTLKHASEIRQGLYDDRQTANDRQTREFSEYIRGVETYDDPVYGGPVELDNSYEHAWRVKNDDTYIMTDDGDFRPHVYGIEATEMKKTE
ncbi:MAG: hypothetical protein ACR2GQ_05965 [Gemmatimonadota bacterium]